MNALNLMKLTPFIVLSLIMLVLKRNKYFTKEENEQKVNQNTI